MYSSVTKTQSCPECVCSQVYTSLYTQRNIIYGKKICVTIEKLCVCMNDCRRMYAFSDGHWPFLIIILFHNICLYYYVLIFLRIYEANGRIEAIAEFE